MTVTKSVITALLLGLCSYSAGRRVADYEKANDRPTASARNTQDASIVNQIHRHDPDGSYTYGYEGSDGSFKVETKTRTGVVTGEYGYVDDSGKLRVVVYGADELGFRPSGEGITVPGPATSAAGSRGRDDAPESPRPVNGAPAKRTQRPAAASRDEPAFVRRPTPAGSRSGPPALRPFDRAQSLPGPWPVDGERTPAPGSYRTVQEFGDGARVAGRSYQTVEDYREPPTEPPASYRPTAGSPRRPSDGPGPAAPPRHGRRRSNGTRPAPRSDGRPAGSA